MRRFKCYKTDSEITEDFLMTQMFLKSQNIRLETVQDSGTALKLSKGFINPIGGYVVEYDTFIARNFVNVFHLVEDIGMLLC